MNLIANRLLQSKNWNISRQSVDSRENRRIGVTTLMNLESIESNQMETKGNSAVINAGGLEMQNVNNTGNNIDHELSDHHDNQAEVLYDEVVTVGAIVSSDNIQIEGKDYNATK